MTIKTFLDDILAYLQTNNFGTIGTDLFAGPLSSSVLNCITVTPSGGTNPKTIKSGEGNFHNPYISIIVKNLSKKTAYDMTIDIYELFRLVPNKQIGNTRFHLIEAKGTVHPLGIDDDKCFSFSINFSLKFY